LEQLKGTAEIELDNGLAEKNSRSKKSLNPKSKPQYAVCVKNTGYLASLELRKIYQLLPDEKALKYGRLRIKDESGEDYLYPADFFVPIKLSASIESAFSRE
jgi:hypothetical protein